MSVCPQLSYAYRLLYVLNEGVGVTWSTEDLIERVGGGSEDIEECIAQLERLGFPLVRDPGGGVSLLPGVDILDRAFIRSRVGSIPIGYEIHYHLETGSTNDLAMEAARSGAPHGSVFISEHQTRGRGRLGRSWFSPPGSGLWFSVVLRPGLRLADSWMVTLGAATAIARAVESTCGIAPNLKWPNDLRYRGKKICGILTEAVPLRGKLDVAVLGIGINVNQDTRELPLDLQGSTISLKQATGRAVSRSELLATVLEELDLTIKNLNPGIVREAWLSRTDMLGAEVCVIVEKRTITGVAVDLTSKGALVVRDSGGGMHHVETGEVTQVSV